MVNGKPCETPTELVTYDTIARLAFPDAKGPVPLDLTIAYRGALGSKPDGTLVSQHVPGSQALAFVAAKDGTVFTCVRTGGA